MWPGTSISASKRSCNSATESEGYLGSGKPQSVGQISWKYVPCPAGETVHFALKEPTNLNWNQFVVSGNQCEIAKVEVRVTGTWVSAAREVYNYWQTPDGKMGAAPYRVRVTDVNGSVLEADVPLAAGDHDSGAAVHLQLRPLEQLGEAG